MTQGTQTGQQSIGVEWEGRSEEDSRGRGHVHTDG